MNKKLIGTLIFALALLASASAQSTKYFNVDMTVREDDGKEPTKIVLKIPLSMIQTMKPQIEQALTEFEVGKDGATLKSMWAEIRKSGPSRFLEVKKPDTNVTVDSTATELEVEIETLAEGQIHIRLPLALGDLLFGNEHVDVQELIEGLTELKTDLVTVQGDRVNGRIWVQ